MTKKSIKKVMLEKDNDIDISKPKAGSSKPSGKKPKTQHQIPQEMFESYTPEEEPTLYPSHLETLNVMFASAECFPMAKVGGLADVVGSLPKYLGKTGVKTSVVIPAYEMPWYEGKLYRIVHQGHFHLGLEHLYFEVRYFIDDILGFPFYNIHIPSKFDRYGVYSDQDGNFFGDEIARNIAFQRAFLTWLRDGNVAVDIVHCHDHHTGLIPFMMKHAYEFKSLSQIPSVFTIHNERYQGAFGWSKQKLLPQFDSWKTGLLEWNGVINPLSSAVRCAYRVTTVSPNYMNELMYNSFGLEDLFKSEYWKCSGIINGIDNEVWDPATDPMIEHHFKGNEIQFKAENKKVLCSIAGFDPSLPLYAFIGRLVLEKGAEFIAGIIDTWLSRHRNINFIVLGTGDKSIESAISTATKRHPSNVACMLKYNEAMSHKIYAGADFLLMPSRVEPCGLNQMFSMRYGTLPIVRTTGGLKDSVRDISESGGVGIRFDHMDFEQMLHAVGRAFDLYHNTEFKNHCVKQAMALDFSWDASANKYKDIYRSIV
ncbi:MAG: glycogen synthase [Saprospiraceae bacterium]|nr:glycogen synthase [Saprospiraceae bacterium]